MTKTGRVWSYGGLVKANKYGLLRSNLGMVPRSWVLKEFAKGLIFMICFARFAKHHRNGIGKNLDLCLQRCRPVQSDLPSQG